MSEQPIFHVHVKVVDRKLTGDGRWFALFLEPNGDTNWINQPVEPKIGEEQILYIIRRHTKEHAAFGEFMETNPPHEAIEKFLLNLAGQHDEICTKSWDEAHALFLISGKPYES